MIYEVHKSKIINHQSSIERRTTRREGPSLRIRELSLAEEGIDEKKILALVHRIVTADPADNLGNIQSLLIARHGRLVFEEYFYGFDAERPHDTRSASKTFAPLLVGIARDHGIPIATDTPLASLFHDEPPFASADARKSHVTLRALMTMTSGFACDDNNDASPGNEDAMQSHGGCSSCRNSSSPRFAVRQVVDTAPPSPYVPAELPQTICGCYPQSVDFNAIFTGNRRQR